MPKVEKAVDPMRASFKAHFGFEWEDPANAEVRRTWQAAWTAANNASANILSAKASQLRATPLKGRIGDWSNAQELADTVDQCAGFLLSAHDQHETSSTASRPVLASA